MLKKSSKWTLFFFIQGSVFWPGKSKADDYFCQPEQKILDNSKKRAFSRLSRVSELNKKKQLYRFNYWSILTYHYLLPHKGWSWLIFSEPKRSFVRAMAPIASSVGRAQRRRRWASPIAVCLKEALPPYLIFLIIQKKLVFPDYRGQSDDNGHRIWIFTSKYATLKKNEGKKSILDVFSLFSIQLTAWHSELSTLNFRNSGNFPDWWDTNQGFFDLQNPNPVFIFVSRHRKPPIIRKFYVFPDYRLQIWN